MKYRKDKRYFKFTNVRTGETVVIKHGITLDHFMELNRKVNEKLRT